MNSPQISNSFIFLAQSNCKIGSYLLIAKEIIYSSDERIARKIKNPNSAHPAQFGFDVGTGLNLMGVTTLGFSIGIPTVKGTLKSPVL